MKVYIASPFFNPEQLSVVKEIEEKYVETLIPPRDHQNNFSKMISVRMLNFTAVVNQFIEALELS